MRITILGSGQSMLNADRAGASIFVENGPEKPGILLDCGPGSLERASAAKIALERIAAVFLSHLHFDHTLALAELLTRLVFHGHQPPIIYGPAGTVAYAATAVEYARAQIRHVNQGRYLSLLHAVRIEEITEGDRWEESEFVVESKAVPHSKMLISQARRISSNGKILIYSGDSGPTTKTMTEFARDADTLVHECYSKLALQQYASTLDEARVSGIQSSFAQSHSEVKSVAKIASSARVSRLVLTHLLPTEEEKSLRVEARREFSGETIIAYDGLSLEV